MHTKRLILVRRKELLLQLNRLEAGAEFLAAQRSEISARLSEISRDRARLRRHLAVLDRGEEASA